MKRMLSAICMVIAVLFFGHNAQATISWDIQVVDNAEDNSGAAPQPSVAVDSEGTIHVSYFKAGAVKYAHKGIHDNSWTISVVDSPSMSDMSGFWTSLALDSYNAPRISYSDKYASWNISGWDIESTGFGNGIHYTSLAIDKKDNPVIA